MKGALLNKGEKYYTDLNKVFDAIGNIQIEYNWLITDCVCYPHSELINNLLSQKYCWLTGKELTDIAKADNFQWIWAVLSGFEKSISKEEALEYPLPYADGYTGFWKNPISIQHPLASIEIVPWDSTLTLIISKQENIISDFLKSFPLSEDLYMYNEER